jgi:hypothetical protein
MDFRNNASSGASSFGTYKSTLTGKVGKIPAIAYASTSSPGFGFPRTEGTELGNRTGSETGLNQSDSPDFFGMSMVTSKSVFQDIKLNLNFVSS